MSKGLDFSKEDVQTASKHKKRHSTSLVIGELQIRTTVRQHLTAIRRAMTKKQKITNVVKDVEKLERLCTLSGNVKLCSC